MSSALSLLLLVLVYCHSLVNSVLLPATLYSFVWNSSIASTSQHDIDIFEIELLYNNEVIDSSMYTLTTNGLSSAYKLTDGDYTSPAYSSGGTEVYIAFNFTDGGQEVGSITLITDCGDINPSDFCSATELIFDTQSYGLQNPLQFPLIDDRIKLELFTYEDDCDINTLVYHQSQTKAVREDIFTNSTSNLCYDIVCKECLLTMVINNEDIEFSHDTNVYFTGYSSKSSNCTCPSYTTKILEDNIVTIYDSNNDKIGELKTSNQEYVLLQLEYWPLNDPSQSINCDLFYWPDSDDYLSVPSLQLISLEFEFNGPSDLMSDSALKTSFDYAFTEYFESLFNLSFVDITTVVKVSNSGLYTISFNSSVTSTEPLMQVNTMLDAYSTQIISDAVTVIANHFSVSENEITGFTIIDDYYSYYATYDSSACSSNWNATTTTDVPYSSNDEVDVYTAIGIGLGALLITICISTGIIYKLRKEEKWCFVGHYVHHQSKSFPVSNENRSDDDGKEGARDASDIYLTERASNVQQLNLMHPSSKNNYSYPKQIQRLDTGAYASKRVLSNLPSNDDANYHTINMANNPQYMAAEQFQSQRVLKHLSSNEVLVDRRSLNNKKESVYFTASNMSDNSNTNDSTVNSAQAKLDANLIAVVRERRVYEFKNFEKELTLVKQIGKGSFGTVYKAKWEANDVAVKLFHGVNQNMTIDKNAPVMIDDEFAKELHAEIISASKVPPHPNIVKIMGFCRVPLCIVLEYMAGGSVQQLVYGLTSRPEPTVIEKLIILKKSCAGLKALTRCDLHHRDIAARNILLGHFERHISDYTQVKITDFGMTREDDKKNNKSAEQQTNSDTGPLKWMAPESIQDRAYNEKTDVYMWAVTMWEIMFGKEPYPNENAVAVAMMVCMKNKRPAFHWDLPDGLKQLIEKCWSTSPDDRFTFDEIMQELHVVHDHHAKDVKEQEEMDKSDDEHSDSTTNR